MKAPKPIFTLNGERYTFDELGQLILLVEEIKVKEDPWQVSNSITETVKILKISRSTVMGIFSGQLKAIKAGAKRWIVPGWAIKEFIKTPTNQK